MDSRRLLIKFMFFNATSDGEIWSEQNAHRAGMSRGEADTLHLMAEEKKSRRNSQDSSAICGKISDETLRQCKKHEPASPSNSQHSQLTAPAWRRRLSWRNKKLKANNKLLITWNRSRVMSPSFSDSVIVCYLNKVLSGLSAWSDDIDRAAW